MIVALPLLIAVVAGVLSYVWPPSFESEAKVRLTRGREMSQTDTTVTKTFNDMTMIQLSVEDVNSEIELLHSDDLMRAVVTEPIELSDGKTITLAEDPSLFDGSSILVYPFQMVRGAINLAMYALQLKERPDDTQIAINRLSERLGTEPVRDSYVIDISLHFGDAELAQIVLGKVIEVYKRLHIEVFANEESAPFFKEQMERIQSDLGKAQADLQDFRAEHNISMVDIEEQLLLEQYADAKKVLAQLAETESAIGGENLDATIISSLSSQTDSTVVREMQLRLLELLLEQNRVAQSLGPRHPTVISISEQIRNTQASLLEAIDNTRTITEKKLASGHARLEQLNELKAGLESKFKDVQILSGNYEFYANKLEEATIADKLAKANISSVKVLAKPSLPVNPYSPNKLLNVVLALAGGLFAGLGIAFALDYLDHGLKTPEDVEAYAGTTTLASFFNKPGQQLDGREVERLATMLDTIDRGEESKIYEVTSSVGGEGAGPVSEALSSAFSQDGGSNTLLIDLTGEIARVRSAEGFSDVLIGDASIDTVFPSGEALAVVGRGSHAQYPSHLWNSARMQEVMSELRRRYKYIVFNVSPVLQSHDAPRLARHADGVVIVVKSDATRREVVARALSMFGESRGKVIGAVLTQRTQSIPSSVYKRI